MRNPAFLASAAALALVTSSLVARAQEITPPREASRPSASFGPSLELNLFGPFLGLSDNKLLIPVVRRQEQRFRGELMLGAYTDFAWGPISRRADRYGKVWIIGVRPGYREYLVGGFFVDASIVVGWRHEEQNLHDGSTLNGFYGRLWANAGWQVDVSSRVFFNARGGAGLALWRTDAYGSFERKWQPAADIDMGVRF